jgi:hypothetical protein
MQVLFKARLEVGDFCRMLFSSYFAEPLLAEIKKGKLVKGIQYLFRILVVEVEG